MTAQKRMGRVVNSPAILNLDVFTRFGASKGKNIERPGLRFTSSGLSTALILLGRKIGPLKHDSQDRTVYILSGKIRVQFSAKYASTLGMGNLLLIPRGSPYILTPVGGPAKLLIHIGR